MAEQKLSVKDFKPTTRTVEEIPWPGSEDRMVGFLCPLTCAELQESFFAAMEHFDRRQKSTDGVGRIEWARELAVQEVFRMLLQPRSQRPKDRLFKDVDELRGALDVEEIAFFQESYKALEGKRLHAMGLLDEAPTLPWEREATTEQGK